MVSSLSIRTTVPTTLGNRACLGNHEPPHNVVASFGPSGGSTNPLRSPLEAHIAPHDSVAVSFPLGKPSRATQFVCRTLGKLQAALFRTLRSIPSCASVPAKASIHLTRSVPNDAGIRAYFCVSVHRYKMDFVKKSFQVPEIRGRKSSRTLENRRFHPILRGTENDPNAVPSAQRKKNQCGEVLKMA